MMMDSAVSVVDPPHSPASSSSKAGTAPWLTIIGDTFCDVIAVDLNEMPQWGGDSLTKIQIHAGGSALNITVHGAAYLEYKARLSLPPPPPSPSSSSSAQLSPPPQLRIKLLSCTGSDLQGQVCKAQLGRFPSIIDTSGVLSRDEWRTGSCVVLSGRLDRSFVTDRGCIDQMSLDYFDDDMFQYNDARHYHIGGFYNCTTLTHEVLSFFRKVSSRRVTTSLNPQCDASGKYDFIPAICPYLTFFIGNEAEVLLVSKTRDGSTLDEQAQTLVDWGCQAVIVTRGKHGAVAYFRDSSDLFDGDGAVPVTGAATVAGPTGQGLRYLKQPSPLVDPVADTTGAGDAFAGAFLVEWCLSRDLRASLRAGCVAGSAAVTLVGGSTTCVSALANAAREMELENLGTAAVI
jgi:hypothetical protein